MNRPTSFLLCALLATFPFGAAADDPARLLAEIRDVSYTRHWHEAQAMLDEMAHRVEGFPLRQQVEFHLLEARHLTLGDRSREALERAGELLELPLDDDQRLRTLQFAANVAVLLREYEAAFEHLLEALAVETEVQDPGAVIDTYNMAGYMFGRVGEYERAAVYGERAVGLALELDDRNRECMARQRLAPVFKWAGLEQRAESEYRAGIAACEQIGNLLFVGVLKHGLADQLRKLGRLEEARDLALESIEWLEGSVFPLGEYEARLVLAEVVHDLGDEEAWAEQDLDGLARYFRERELWDQLARLEALFSDRAESAGHPQQALTHLRDYLDARERFLGRDRAMLLAYLQVEFDTRLKDQQIELLAESARVARVEQQAAEQQRRARSAILVLSSALLVLLVVMLLGALRGRRHFRYLSRHDPLSGLANQGWFLQRAEAMLDQARQSNAGACLILADIDHFKRINDRYGHLVGDGVIGQTARRLREAFGEDALVGRIGGEEFGIMMLTGEIADVVDAIERFQQSGLESGRSGDPHFTLSFGVSRLQSGDSLSDLRSRADQGLYEAKRAGRNRYVLVDKEGVGASVGLSPA
jgi:diguanylate cyclase